MSESGGAVARCHGRRPAVGRWHGAGGITAAVWRSRAHRRVCIFPCGRQLPELSSGPEICRDRGGAAADSS